MTTIISHPRDSMTTTHRDGTIIETDPNTGYPIKTAGVVPIESILLGAEATRRARYAEERRLQEQQRGYCCDKLKQAVDAGFVVQDSIPYGKWLMRDLRTADIVFDHEMKFCPFCMRPLVAI